MPIMAPIADKNWVSPIRTAKSSGLKNLATIVNAAMKANADPRPIKNLAKDAMAKESVSAKQNAPMAQIKDAKVSKILGPM